METPALDKDAFVELKSIMGDTLVDILKIYLETMPQMLVELKTVIENDDATQTFEIAHRIKSSSSSIGALGIAETAQVIELTGRSGSTQNTLPSLEILNDQFSEIQPFLASELNA